MDSVFGIREEGGCEIGAVGAPWRRSAMSQKPVLYSINNRLADIKAEKYGPRLIMLAN